MLFVLLPRHFQLIAVAWLSFGLTLMSYAQLPATVAPPEEAPAIAPVVPPAKGTVSRDRGVPAPLQRPGEASGPYKIYLNTRYADDKEARAVIHMFGRKQTGGALWLIGGAAFLGFVSSQTGTTTTSSGTTTSTVTPLGYLIFAGLPAGIAIGKFSRFSNRELYKTLVEYDATHSFPGYVIAKLGRSDYH